MARIEDLLHRRTDLSTFLVHLTRATGTTARENLIAMITGGDEGVMAIKARSAFGPGRDYDKYLGDVATQKVVCFTETPLEHIWMMLENIEGRSTQFEPWGLATTKTAARKAGCSPVWYTNKSAERWDKNPGKYVRRMIEEAVTRSKQTNGDIDCALLQAEPVFRITPFIEEMGHSMEGVPKEFWWEREWRHVGDFSLGFPSRIVAILAPEGEHDSLRAEMENSASGKWLERPIIDPHWGLERMISAMSRVNPKYLGPFPDVN
jgi:Putative abortive phage resistance protein AbiGi, antitoxin